MLLASRQLASSAARLPVLPAAMVELTTRRLEFAPPRVATIFTSFPSLAIGTPFGFVTYTPAHAVNVRTTALAARLRACGGADVDVASGGDGRISRLDEPRFLASCAISGKMPLLAAYEF
ncbi:hypothetical protein ACSFA2_24700 [Variovorax sp. LT2P21]|uniref:hypothetical protein n=1 Tax=Variovorax sp. LT2P21 TaxID=3443731 RepID=UPI003F48A1CF